MYELLWICAGVGKPTAVPTYSLTSEGQVIALLCRADVQMEGREDSRVSPACSHGDAPRRVPGQHGCSVLLLLFWSPIRTLVA